jgi:hypothetical protein
MIAIGPVVGAMAIDSPPRTEFVMIGAMNGVVGTATIFRSMAAGGTMMTIGMAAIGIGGATMPIATIDRFIGGRGQLCRG